MHASICSDVISLNFLCIEMGLGIFIKRAALAGLSQFDSKDVNLDGFGLVSNDICTVA